jgi:glycopeptide antibiotics resistance protein
LILGTKRPDSKHVLIVGTIVLAILLATVLPSRNGPLRQFSSCFVCDFRWLADGVLNVGLFLPLGMAIGWRGRSFWKTTLGGAALSTVVELLQMRLPGRDPELRDIVANTLGAALGAALVYRPRAWLTPGPRVGRWFLAITVVVVAAVIVSTGRLLVPARLDGPLSVTRIETDAVVRYKSRAEVIGLDQPAYYVRGMFDGIDASTTIPVDVSRRRTGLCLRVEVRERCRIGPTLGRGWSVFIYPTALPHRWGDELVDLAWTMILFFPLGFFTPRRSLVVSLGAAVVLLAAVPFIVGIVPTTIAEAVAVMVAIVSVQAIANAIRRRLEIVRV